MHCVACPVKAHSVCRALNGTAAKQKLWRPPFCELALVSTMGGKSTEGGLSEDSTATTTSLDFSRVVQFEM